MKKLILISALLLFSVDAFAQAKYVHPNNLPFGEYLAHETGNGDVYQFFEDGNMKYAYYGSELINGELIKKKKITVEEGVWATHKGMYDTQIRIYLGSTQCTYQIKKIADTFIFTVAQNTTNSSSCYQKLLKIYKEN